MGFMTLGEMTDEVSLNLGGKTPDPKRLSLWINFAIYNIISKYKFDEFRTTDDITIVAGTGEYALPEDFLGLVTLEVNGRRLRKTRRRPMDSTPPDSVADRGAPSYWFRRGANIVIWPVPDAVYTAVLEYVFAPARLVDPDELAPFTAIWDAAIVYLATSHGFMALGDKEGAILRLNMANEYMAGRIKEQDYEADAIKEGVNIAWTHEDIHEDPHHLRP